MNELTMSVSGKIVELGEKLATLKVKTELGFAFVWVWEEIQIHFQVGDMFRAEDTNITFSDGYPIAMIKPGNMFFLNDSRYETKDVSL